MEIRDGVKVRQDENEADRSSLFSDDVLKTGLKRVDSIPAMGRRSVEGRLNIQEIKTACMILNTAEYCQNTSLQLEERVKGKIAEEFKEGVSYQAERETFTG